MIEMTGENHLKSDDTLLTASGIPTIDDLKAYFQANDFTAYANGMAVHRLAPSEERTYGKIKKCFSDYWNSSLKSLGVEQFGRYFSSDSPITVLKSADSKIVISKVLEIQRDDTLTEQYYDAFFTIVEDQLTEKVKAYAESVGKDTDDLSDDEIMMCVDEMSDALLSKMMLLLQQTQSVPEIAQIQKKGPQLEDFSYTADNHAKTDYLRRWNHSRTKIGPMLSLDEMMENYEKSIKEAKENAEEGTEVPEEVPPYDRLTEDEHDSDDIFGVTEQFLHTLSETDRKIFLLTVAEKKQEEIAAALGYKNNSAVSKRMKKIREEYRRYLADHQIYV